MKWIWLIGLMVFLLSCSNSTLYKQDYTVDESGWDYKDTLEYQFDIHDTLQSYNLLINLKYRDTYAYSNLYFFVDVIDPQNQKYRDTIECIMATPQGRWLGKQSGDYIEHRFLYRYNVNFPKSGQYRIYLQQAMRDTLLKKISSVGIELQKFKEKLD